MLYFGFPMKKQNPTTDFGVKSKYTLLVSRKRSPVFRMGNYAAPDFQSISGSYFYSFSKTRFGTRRVCFVIIPNHPSNVLLDLKSAGFHRVTVSPEALKMLINSTTDDGNRTLKDKGECKLKKNSCSMNL